jgi:hypothetical protein
MSYTRRARIAARLALGGGITNVSNSARESKTYVRAARRHDNFGTQGITTPPAIGADDERIPGT